MPKPPIPTKPPSSSTAKAIRDLSTARLDSQTARIRGQLLTGILHRIPYPIVRLLPFLRTDIKALLRHGQQGPAVVDQSEEIVQLPTTWGLDPESEASPYLQYRCPHHPLNCPSLQQGQLAKTAADPDIPKEPCSQCHFPGLLAENAELQGQRGRYRVGQFLGKRGWGRLYLGQDINRRQPVVIREYLLPRQHVSSTEQQLIRDTFENVAGLKLADGREHDFRLMRPLDVMGDRRDPERCYLITNAERDRLPTLRTHLTQTSAMSPIQVRTLLSQGLQTLSSLHGQKYTLPAGQLQTGLVHGNISLDSIVIQPDANSYYETPQLLIFLRDLALWESLFIPPPVPPHIPTKADDLTALGQVGLYALLGRWSDHYGRELKPHSFHAWPRQDLFLEQYLRQLLGIEEPTFDTAAEARRVLLQLPTAPVRQVSQKTTVEIDAKQHAWPQWVWWLLAGLGLLSMAFIMGMVLLRWLRPALSSTPPSPCCIADVAAVPPGEFHYAAANPGTWYPLWHSRNLITQDKTLEQVLEAEQPDLNLQLDPVKTNTLAIQQVEADQVDFAIAPYLTPLAPDLTVAPIAYDGLAVFVAFSYVERQQSLPQHLRGQLSIDQLRQLYTGEIENWSDLGGPDLAVKLYIPDQVELIEAFEQRVLQTPEAIQSFRRQWDLEEIESDATLNTRTIPLIASAETINGDIRAPLDMLQSILKDFEATPQVGSIGFTSVSQIYNQCSVYPLAIAPDQHSSAVQPFYQANDTPISPAIDLCGDKGNYGPNPSLFVNPTLSRHQASDASKNTPVYPLAYPLAVMYRRDNSRLPIGVTFVEMMTTKEGQQLLKKTGLIPLESVSE